VAIAEYRKAIELNPEFLEAHYNLALALAKVPSRSRESIAQLEDVLPMRPDLADARNLLERLRMSGRPRQP
jgi:tetratricopeptide (TPR) repeat protein